MIRCLVFSFTGLILVTIFAASTLQNQKKIELDDPFLHKIRGYLYYGDSLFTGILVDKYANGQKRFQISYQLGKEHGVAQRWYPNQQLHSIRTYKEGKKHGEHCGWWENGIQKFVYRFEKTASQGEQREWYQTGQLHKVKQYDNGQEAGLQQGWNQDGKIMFNYVFKNGKRYGLLGTKPCITVQNKIGS